MERGMAITGLRTETGFASTNLCQALISLGHFLLFLNRNEESNPLTWLNLEVVGGSLCLTRGLNTLKEDEYLLLLISLNSPSCKNYKFSITINFTIFAF